MLNRQKCRIKRYVDKYRINIETDNDAVEDCRFFVASEKFDNELDDILSVENLMNPTYKAKLNK